MKMKRIHPGNKNMKSYFCAYCNKGVYKHSNTKFLDHSRDFMCEDCYSERKALDESLGL